jgi:hypothetical protein
MQVYKSNKGIQFLIVSSASNEGTGAVVCRLSHAQNRIIRVPSFMIENNDAMDVSFIHQISPTSQTLCSTSLVRALVNARKHYFLSSHDLEPFKSHALMMVDDLIVELATQA